MVETKVTKEEFNELKGKFNDLLELLDDIGLKKKVDFSTLEVEEDNLEYDEDETDETDEVKEEEIVKQEEINL